MDIALSAALIAGVLLVVLVFIMHAIIIARASVFKRLRDKLRAAAKLSVSEIHSPAADPGAESPVAAVEMTNLGSTSAAQASSQ